MTKGLNPTNKTFVFFFNPSPQELLFLLFLRSLPYIANAAWEYTIGRKGYFSILSPCVSEEI